MSTKTTLKRIALVAVSALGFGLMTSVAPASAASGKATSITIGTVGPARVGTTLSVSVTLGLPTNFSGADETMTVGAKVISAPTGSAFNTVPVNAAGSPVVNGSNVAGATASGNQVAAKLGWTSSSSAPRLSDVDGANEAHNTVFGTANGTNVVSGGTDRLTAAAYVTDATYNATTNTTGGATLNIIPDVAGTYTILVHSSDRVVADGTAAGAFAAGDTVTQFTFTTAGAPTSLTATAVAGAVTTGAQFGQLFSLTMKDANGNATRLGLNEAITVSDNSTDVDLFDGSTSKGSALTAFGATSANTAGTYYVRAAASGNAVPAAAGTAVLTFTGSGTLPATLTVQSTVTLTAVTAAAGTITLACTTATNCTTTDGGTTAWAGTGTGYSTGSQSLTFSGLTTGLTTAAVIHAFEVSNNAGLKYNTSGTIAAATTAATKLATTAPAISSSASALSVSVTLLTALSTSSTTGTTATLAYGAPVAKIIAVSPTVNVLSATGGTTNWTIEIDDQYGTPIAFAPVTVSSTGRNAVASRTLGVTNADGLITYAHKDAGTTGTTDTLIFGGAGTSATRTVTYGTVTVDSVAVAGGSKAETVAGSTITPISAADNGPDAGAKSIKATIKDANGNLLAGVPVTFTVDAGAIKKTASVDYSVVYTDSTGVAETFVLGWKSGKQTITATAGGKSGTDYFTWGQTTPSSARVLSGTVNGNILSYKVVDRFGNPVKDAVISLSRTGTGLFGTGVSTQTINTDVTGAADATFTGDATVVAELATTTQGYDKAGFIGTTAVTAATAGTTAGIGDTLAPAGVGKVELKVALGVDASTVAANAAADAAAEAIDAANAATDAANLAAEAADAATVAAEEARDAADAATAAVEELATQVATLMAALKAQITTLANTVAKIAKKVRA